MSNCEGNVYHIGMGCCVPKIVNPDLYYTKEEVDEKIDDIEVSGITEEKAQEIIDESLESYYTKTEVDGFVSDLETADSVISGAVDNLSSSLTTEAQRAISSEQALDGKIDTVSGNLQTQIQTIENELQGDYASKEWVSGYTYDKQTIEDMIEEGGGFIPENYYDKDATDALLAKKANTATTYTKTNVNTLLEKKADTATTYTKDEINAFMETLEADDSVISGAVDSLSNELHNNYYTKGGVLDAISAATSIKADVTALTQTNNALVTHRTDSGIHVTSSEKETWNNKSDFSGDYNDLTNKPTIPTVPTNVSAFNNDSGYITSNAITGKADTTAVTQVNSALTAHTANTDAHVTSSEKTTWNNKSDFSGDYNDLTNKPTIPSYTAGSGITISNDTISAKIWSGTKAAYEALTTKDSDTIYLIYNE